MSIPATFGNDNQLVRRGIRRDFVGALLKDIGVAQELMDSTKIEGSSRERTNIRREVKETVNFLAAIDNWENEMLDSFLRIRRCISKERQGHERKEIVGELKDVVVKMKKLKAKVPEIVPLKPEDIGEGVRVPYDPKRIGGPSNPPSNGYRTPDFRSPNLETLDFRVPNLKARDRKGEPSDRDWRVLQSSSDLSGIHSVGEGDRVGNSAIFKEGESSNNSWATNFPVVTTTSEDDRSVDDDWLNIDTMNLTTRESNFLKTIALFPAGKPVKKRVLINWWNAIFGYLDDERALIDMFNNFIEKGVLKAKRIRKHNGLIDSFVIHPAIHRLLEPLAENVDFHRFEGLVVQSTLYLFGFGSGKFAFTLNLNQKHLNTKYISKILHNLHQDGKIPEIHLVHFGMWNYFNREEDKNENDYIEADGIKFLETMGEDLTVRYLSLNGISRIEELPQSVGKWWDLRILDLRDCHNFQNWPQKPKAKMRITVEENHWFMRLTYLDVTGCYLLDHMPKWLPELSDLQVLKGAVFNGFITDQCRLRDIARLKLTKLSIKIMNCDSFSIEDVTALEHMQDLPVLTIIWGAQQAEEMEIKGGENPHDSLNIINSTVKDRAGVHKDKTINEEKQNRKTMPNNCWVTKGKKKPSENKDIDSKKMPTISFPRNLEKLDLWCYLNEMAPELVKAAHLEKLERLYIRGGKLTELTGVGYQRLKILRLRFLRDLDSDEKELRNMFPRMEYRSN